MQITYILLKNFKRFPLLDVEIFEHEFKSKLTMITGSNGAGKSSLFNELTPLPSDKANFNKGGYKEIHIRVRTSEYKLISDFRDGTKFHFIVDGEERNLSHNVTTQRELVLAHFNITPAIHELLVGGEVFTTMSLLSRKKLFAAITHLNIDKVLEGYNSLREELKNNELILKTQTSLLQSEEQKLLDKTRLDSMKETQVRTKEFIDFLLDMRTALHRYTTQSDPDQVYIHHKTLLSKIKETASKNYLRLTAYPKRDIERLRLQYTTALNLVNYQLQGLYSSLEKKQDEIKALGLSKQSSISDLQQRQAELLSAISQINSKLGFLKDTEVPFEQIKSDIYKLTVSLPDILPNLPTNPLVDGKRKFSKDNYETLLENKRILLERLTTLSSQELQLTKELQELSSTHDDVSCPNCQHTWSPKDIPALLTKTKQKLQVALTEKVDVQTRLSTNTKDLEEIVDYFTQYKQYASLRNTTKDTLKVMWSYIDGNEMVFTAPSSVLYAVERCNVDAMSIETRNQYQKELAQIETDLQTLSSVKDLSLASVEEQTQELTATIADCQRHKSDLQEQLAELNRAASVHSYLDKLQNALNGSLSDLFSVNLSTCVSDILIAIESDLSKQKVILIETENELHRYNSIQYTIEKYKKTIEDVQTNIKVLNVVLDELSPKNGLIAKSVSSFLNIIITNINKTIAGLWGYKMILKPINVEADALNYKFKVEVEDKLEIQDISLASKGMQEAINLSFKLILYKLLGLEGTPLYLDELASHMDKNHTTNVVSLIHQLSLSEKYSQIFIVSHKENFTFLRDVEHISLS